MNPTRTGACFLFMQRALVEPTALELNSEKEARSWRFTCYQVRRGQRLAGITKFDNLLFKVKGNILEGRTKL